MPQDLAEEFRSIPMSSNLGHSLERAHRFAREQSHRMVTLEHLLLALVEDPEAALILQSANVDLARLGTDVSGYLGRLLEDMRAEGNVEPGPEPDLLRVLQAAVSAAHQSKRRQIDGAIVLAALVGDGKSPAAGLLKAHGMTFEEAIRALQRANTKARLKPAPAAPPKVVTPGAVPPPRPAAAVPPPPAPAEPAAAEPPPAEPLPAPAPSAAGGDDFLAAARARIQQRAAPRASPAAPEAAPPQAPAHAAAPAAPPEPEADEVPAASMDSAETEALTHAIEAAMAAPVTRRNEPALPLPPSPAPLPAGELDPADTPPTRPPVRPSWTPPAEPRPAARHPVPPRAPQPQPARPPHVAEAAIPRAPMPPPAATPPPYVNGPPPRAPWPESVEQRPPASVHPLPQPGAHPHHPPHQAPPPHVGGELGLPAHATLHPPGSGPVARPAQPHRPAPAQRSAHPERGPLVENIPRRMRLGVPAGGEVRISRDRIEGLLQALSGGAPIRPGVPVARALSVRLRAPGGGFLVEAQSPETQWVESASNMIHDDDAVWRWTILPQVRGRSRLLLMVSARSIGPDGIAVETAPPDRIIEVRVGASYGRALGRWAGWLLALLAGVLLGRFGEALVPALVTTFRLMTGV